MRFNITTSIADGIARFSARVAMLRSFGPQMQQHLNWFFLHRPDRAANQQLGTLTFIQRIEQVLGIKQQSEQFAMLGSQQVQVTKIGSTASHYLAAYSDRLDSGDTSESNGQPKTAKQGSGTFGSLIGTLLGTSGEITCLPSPARSNRHSLS